MKVKFTISYDGSGFCGWQRQIKETTVQGCIEDALKKLYGKDFSIMASGRTDEGVHAYAQVASVEVPDNIPPERMVYALNFLLPEKIKIISCERMNDDFNALKSSKKKTYIYDMYLGNIDNPLLFERAVRVDADIDINAMQTVGDMFVGEHNFTAFRCRGSSAKTSVRTLYEFSLERVELFGSNGLRLRVSGNGFLYKMVRSIVGTLLQVGSGKMTKDDVQLLLDSGEEWDKKIVAPSCGLYLYNVEYTESEK